jgi:hypothetical protein
MLMRGKIMNKRLLLLSLFIILLLSGLTAGLFSNSIRRALTLPMSSLVKQNVAQAQPTQPAQLVQPTATPAIPVLMPQTVLAQDTFQRTNQPLWGTASGGRQWDGDANTQTNIFSINANHGQIANGQGTFNALLGPTASNAEALLDGSLSHFNGSANLGIVLRYTDANDWYKALIDGTHLTILKRANSQTTQLVSVPFVAQDNQSYTLRFRIVGAMLFARAWPTGSPEPVTWLAMATDNTFQNGQAGVRVVLQQGLLITITTFSVTTASSMV